MIIRCTQKLLAELKIGLMQEPSDNDPFWSWHANVFHVERRKCVLITNDMTLFTMLIPGLKTPDFKSFHFVIGEHLFKNLLYENIPQPQIEAVLSQCRNMTFQKTTNRRVLGSMNDQKTQLEYLISTEGGLARTNIYELNKEVNRVTFSAINRRRPIDVLKEELRNHDE